MEILVLHDLVLADVRTLGTELPFYLVHAQLLPLQLLQLLSLSYLLLEVRLLQLLSLSYLLLKVCLLHPAFSLLFQHLLLTDLLLQLLLQLLLSQLLLL
jgi:hypothetical protein